MRKLIRCKRTQNFLTKDGTWSSDFQKAAEFADPPEAHAAVEQFQLQEVEMYYSFHEDATSQYDFAIPLK
jgi:hypothetical protein